MKILCSILFYIYVIQLIKQKKKNSDVLLWLNLDEILDSIVFREYDDLKLIYRQALDKELIREYLKLLKIIR